MKEPSSRTHAAFADWEHPISREAMHLLDLIDVLLMRWMPKGKFKPSHRVWDAAALRRSAQRLNDESLHKKLRPHLYQ